MRLLPSILQLGRQTLLLTRGLIAARYRRTWAGFVWVTLNPVLKFIAQIIVFDWILRVPTQDYALFLVTGLLPWHFLTQSLEMGTNQLLDYSRWLRSFDAHPSVYVLAQVLDCLVSFSAAFLFLFALAAADKPTAWVGLTLLPLAVLPLLVFTAALSWLFAVLQVFFRDTRFLLGLGIQVGFFLTPIFYPAELVPESLRWMVVCNPVHYFLEPFRHALFDPNLEKFWSSEFVAVSLALGTAAVSIWFGERQRGELVLYV